MLVWMRHEKHGRMPCYSTGEVTQAQVHGWYVEVAKPVEKAQNTAAEVPNVAESAALPVQGVRAPRKRGRPPKVKRDGNGTDTDQ